nr:hypothetical protein CFP56_24269 [Quercus suber]
MDNGEDHEMDGVDEADGANGANAVNGVNGANGLHGVGGANGVHRVNGDHRINGVHAVNGVHGDQVVNGVGGVNAVNGMSTTRNRNDAERIPLMREEHLGLFEEIIRVYRHQEGQYCKGEKRLWTWATGFRQIHVGYHRIKSDRFMLNGTSCSYVHVFLLVHRVHDHVIAHSAGPFLAHASSNSPMLTQIPQVVIYLRIQICVSPPWDIARAHSNLTEMTRQISHGTRREMRGHNVDHQRGIRAKDA